MQFDQDWETINLDHWMAIWKIVGMAWLASLRTPLFKKEKKTKTPLLTLPGAQIHDLT